VRILITGASGSGTTSLGRELAGIRGWDFFDADDYYWIPTDPPYTEKRDHSRRMAKILNDLSLCSNAVVSGSIMNWGLELEDSFDLVVFLYLDTKIRVQRVQKRDFENFGSVDPKFIRWLSEYDTGPSEGRSLARHNDWLSNRNCKVVRIVGDLTVKERVELVSKHIA
jgi:uridine kinase